MNKDINSNKFSENWIITPKGELVQLGDDFDKPGGFTIEGFNDKLEPIYGFSRNWKSIDDFLGIE